MNATQTMTTTELKAAARNCGDCYNPYRTVYHRDGAVTIWDVYAQSWYRTADPGDEVLASLSVVERQRVMRHVAR